MINIITTIILIMIMESEQVYKSKLSNVKKHIDRLKYEVDGLFSLITYYKTAGKDSESRFVDQEKGEGLEREAMETGGWHTPKSYRFHRIKNYLKDVAGSLDLMEEEHVQEAYRHTVQLMEKAYVKKGGRVGIVEDQVSLDEATDLIDEINELYKDVIRPKFEELYKEELIEERSEQGGNAKKVALLMLFVLPFMLLLGTSANYTGMTVGPYYLSTNLFLGLIAGIILSLTVYLIKK
jgi:hypothetical protein